jgi:hypothetical protein
MGSAVNIKKQQSKTIGDILAEILGFDLNSAAANPIITEIAVRELGECLEADMLDGTLQERFARRLGNKDQALYAVMALKDTFKNL